MNYKVLVIGLAGMAVIAAIAIWEQRHRRDKSEEPARRDAANQEPLALEEWKQLQAIITRYETQEFQLRNWCLVLLGALVASLFSDKTRLDGATFAYIAFCITAAFGVMELIVRLPKRKAIERTEDVERMLRGNCDYDTPRISVSLGSRWDHKSVLKHFRQEAFQLAFFGFYFSILTIAVMVDAAAPQLVATHQASAEGQ